MIGVVAHDAGGAEVLSSYIQRNNLDCLCSLEGPAKTIFKKKLGKLSIIPLEKLIDRCDQVICGTSLLSDFEWNAMKLAIENDRSTVAVLDHWVNYRQRFIRNDRQCFPDEVWAGDDLGYHLATKAIPESRVTLIPNPYYLDLRDEFITLTAPRRTTNGLRILFVCEPLRKEGLKLFGDERYWGHTEEDALRYFLTNLSSFTNEIDRIVLRPHPREENDKYDWAVKEFDLPIFTESNKTLVNQVTETDVVIGGATMAMVVGLIAKKRVVCCLPPNSKVTKLPHTDIESMSSFVNSFKKL